ncbi:hypothetical protein, partial [Pedobacter nutrimenti]|uniref:hypothetical protein n=1 Tax=Pedobacter nutrimenti TaxID=1241337 RepID=UPI00292EBB43
DLVENCGHAAPRLNEIRRTEKVRSSLRPFRSIPQFSRQSAEEGAEPAGRRQKQGPDNNRKD